jgi:hypothetical protein
VSRKHWIWAGVAVLLLVVVGGYFGLRGQVAYAQIATSYAAKQTCSCLHVSGRSMESCIADFPEDARDSLSVTQEGDVVRASVLFGAISAEAVVDGEYGCRVAG